MANEFKAEVFQNQYLSRGAREVHAIMTVTASEATAGSQPGKRLFGIVCDASGSMEGGKIVAARDAIVKLINLLPEDCHFFIIAGATETWVVSPMLPASPLYKGSATASVKNIRANGGTVMSTWIEAARAQFQSGPPGIRQALLLTDGLNDETDSKRLEQVLAACEGEFQCECRGVGTDWKIDELRKISSKLLGRTDIIAAPAQMEGDFRAILEKSLNKSLGDVFLRLWTPLGAAIKFCKEVSPEIVDLSNLARQPKPQIREYPTGAWGAGEARDFHFCIEVKPGEVGDEMLAGRASLVYWRNNVETKVAEARILAVWTDDDTKSAKIDRTVAHYTGQAELAR